MLQLDAAKLGTTHQWNIRALSWDEVEMFWDAISAALDETEDLWGEYYSKGDILTELFNQHMHMIAAAKDEVVVLLTLCAVITYPKGRRLMVFWMQGEGLEEAAVLMDQALENFARLTDCKFIDGKGRRGWEKFTKRLGYRFASVQVTRPVHEGSIQ